MSLFLLLQILVIIRFSLAQSTAAPDEFKESHAFVTVSRGVRSSPDTLNICSRDNEPLVRYFKKPDVLKTMNCSALTEEIKCHGNPTLKQRHHCRCKVQTATYNEGQRHCINNGEMRQGCDLRFGSFQYNSGWKWNKLNDPFLSMYFNPGFAITGSFNASKQDYADCTLTNITLLNQAGEWELFIHDPTTVKIYTLRKMFQISWQTNYINSETKEKLSGKLLRFYVTCDPVYYGIDFNKKPLISCLVFKATGNATFFYAQIPEQEKGDSINDTVIALVIVFSLLLIIIGIVLGIFIFRRRRATGKDCWPRRCWKA